LSLPSASVAALLIALVGCGYLIAAALLVDRFMRQRGRASPAAAPDVTILKPLHGDEPGLLDNLASFCAQDYSGRVQIICGVQDPGDRAVAVVERLRERLPACAIDLVIETTLHGLNRKVSNLVNMAPSSRYDVVVLSDSDIRVEPTYLREVVAALEQPGVRGVTCLYYGLPVTGLWARLSALGINAHFLPSVVAGVSLGLARPCFGSTVALRRSTLAEIGGFVAFADSIADDYAIGHALRVHGGTVAIPPFAIAHICGQTSARQLWLHELRWARTIRSVDPAGYAGSIIAHPLPWALIGIVLGAGSAALWPAVGLAVAAIMCRMALLWRVEQAGALPPQPYWLVPGRDLFSFAVFVVSFLGRGVSWKGHRYRMLAGGGWAADRGSHTR
jgi:ceramide glucosyltransferase